MNKAEFADFARSLAAYYGRQAMSQDRLETIYPKIQDVPAEAVRWILGRITDEQDNMPVNVGKAVLAGWYDWQRAHPDRIVQAEKYRCPECRHGHLFVQRIRFRGNLAIAQTGVFRCKTCMQASEQQLPLAFGWQLFADGWELQPLDALVAAGVAPKRKRKMNAGLDDERERARRVRHVPEAEQEVCPF